MSILPILIRRGVSGSVPERPTGISAQGGVGFISISWTPASSGVTDVKLYSSSDGGNNFQLLASVSGSEITLGSGSYNHTGLDGEVTRHYYVVFSNEFGDSLKSSTVFANTTVPDIQGGFGTAYITSASLIEGTKYLDVTFNETITSISSAAGFRLIGGVARIQNINSGVGTNKLRFNLTDFPLPDDEFKVEYWQFLGDAQSTTGKVNVQSYSNVINNNTIWWGNVSGVGDTSRHIYYVNTSTGNNSTALVNDETRPWASPQTAINLAQPGDYVLLRRGQTFTVSSSIEFPRNGTSSAHIVLGAYGPVNSGNTNKPVIRGSIGSNRAPVNINRSFCHANNLRLEQTGSGVGLRFGDTGNSSSTLGTACNSPMASSCDVIGGSSSYAGLYSRRRANVTNWLAFDNSIQGFDFGLRCSGYPYNSGQLHNVYGGLIENNHFINCRSKDMTNTQRGYYHNFTFRKNKIEGWREDAMDCFAARDIIIEYNEVCNPQQNQSNGGDGIKAGGVTANASEAQEEGGFQARNIVVRYNYVHDLDTTTDNRGIFNNAGAEAKIYGNLVVNCTGVGIKIDNFSVSVDRFDIHHNTVINCLKGLVVGSNGGNVYAYNNILHGTERSIESQNGNTTQITGSNNILSGSTSSYNATNDITGVAFSTLMINPNGQSSGDYHLKAGSAAINAGTTVNGYSQDFEGKKLLDGQSDIGCFEYVTSGLQDVTIHLVGDSTVKLSEAGKEGWGEYFSNYVNASATVNNAADSGESSISYYSDFWPAVRDSISAQDFVLIQFGHNDRYSSKSGTTAQMTTALNAMIDETRARSAKPILITPVERMIPTSFNSHGSYDDTVRTVAANKSVPLLDLQSISQETFLYLYSLSGNTSRIASDFATADYPPSGSDETHFSAGGADRICRMVVSLINASSSTVKNYISNQNFTWDKTNYA